MKEKNQLRFFKKPCILVVCIVFIICSLIAGIAIFLKYSNEKQQSTKQNSFFSDSITPPETNPDWYTPNHDNPSVEEIFSTAPFDSLMPRAGLENYTMTDSIRYLQDDFSNPTGKINIKTYWKNSDNEMCICIDEYDSNTKFQAFYPSDITKDMLNSHERKGTIKIIYGDYWVTYDYNGADFSADKLFEIITSSIWFKELKK